MGDKPNNRVWHDQYNNQERLGHVYSRIAEVHARLNHPDLARQFYGMSIKAYHQAEGLVLQIMKDDI